MKILVIVMMLVGSQIAIGQDLGRVHLSCYSSSKVKVVLSSSVDNDDVLVRVESENTSKNYRGYHGDLAFMRARNGESYTITGYLTPILRGRAHLSEVGELSINSSDLDVNWRSGRFTTNSGLTLKLICFLGKNEVVFKYY